MNNTSKKAGYLKGLLEGAGLEDGSPNARLLRGIVDLLGDLSDRIDIMEDLLNDLNDYVESIDDDLTALEAEDDDPFGFMDDDDEDDDDFEDADSEQLRLVPNEPDEEEAEDDLSPVICPECKCAFRISARDPFGASYV